MAIVVVGVLLVLPAAAVFVVSHQATHASARSNPTGLTPFWDKPVRFVETGLANGTHWSVNLSGTIGSSTTHRITFLWILGTYPFTVIPVAGYTAVPSAGNVTVRDKGAWVHILFTPIVAASNYTVSFTETGLPTGTPWWVQFNGANRTSTTSPITFSVVNGTYFFTDAGTISSSTGERFVASLTNGTVVVNGTNRSVTIPYLTQFLLSTSVSPSGAGNVTPVSGWFPAGASVVLSETPATGFAFLNWSGSGNGSYSGTNQTPTIAMNGPINETAIFGPGYAVDFEELGLLDGVTWSVTFNGVTQSAFFVFLDFSAPNGTFPYSVAPIAGYHADSYHGNVTVAGKDVTVVIHWVRLTYNVSFVETGLPSGTTWSVTLNGTTVSLAQSTLPFIEGNGSYPFTVAPISGYTPNVTAGTVLVVGLPVIVAVNWTAGGPVHRTHTLMFIESGLPVGNPWSVTLNGTTSVTQISSATTTTFAGLSDGSYHFWIPDVGGYRAAEAVGAVSIAGANATVNVGFATLGPAATPVGGVQISAVDLVIFALIGGAGLVAAYLIYRRE